MPNYVDNYMTILVPAGRADELKDAIRGPSFWPHPFIEANMVMCADDWTRRLSNHHLVELDGNTEHLIERFRATPAGRARPDWMPVSRLDVVGMLLGEPQRDLEEVPLSIPRLAPLTDRAEFDDFFPGVEDGPFWNYDPKARYNTGEKGAIALNRARIGVKWAPGDVELVREDVDAERDTIALRIRYTTPWGPAEKLEDTLAPTLWRFGARMLVVWTEEDNQSGYTYLDPSRGLHLEADYGHEFSIDGEQDEDGYEMSIVDRVALSEAVAFAIEDADLSEHFF